MRNMSLAGLLVALGVGLPTVGYAELPPPPPPPPPPPGDQASPCDALCGCVSALGGATAGSACSTQCNGLLATGGNSDDCTKKISEAGYSSCTSLCSAFPPPPPAQDNNSTVVQQPLPEGSGLCLKAQGPCGEGDQCAAGAMCSVGICYTPDGQCKTGNDCPGGDVCVVFGKACSDQMACAPGEMCGETGQCLSISFSTNPPGVTGGMNTSGGTGTQFDMRSPADSASEEDAGAPETSASSEEGADEASGAPNGEGAEMKPAVSICSVSTPSGSQSSGVIGLLMVGLGLVFERRRRAR